MFNIFQNLLSNLTKFAEARGKNREKFVDRYVEPVYKDAETIYKDYCILLRGVREKVIRAKKISPILKYLEEKRQENLPTRTKVRAVLIKNLEEKKLTRFERGIWGLMMGSVTAFDNGHCSFEPIHWGDHTILDIVNRIATRGITEITPADRDDMLRFVDRQIKGINQAWGEVVAGYADLRAIAIPTSSLPKSKVYNPKSCNR